MGKYMELHYHPQCYLTQPSRTRDPAKIRDFALLPPPTQAKLRAHVDAAVAAKKLAQTQARAQARAVLAAARAVQPAGKKLRAPLRAAAAANAAGGGGGAKRARGAL